MSLQQMSVRRRQRAESDDEHRPSSSGSGKRQRGNNANGHILPDSAFSNSTLDESLYQRGAILRVSLVNFVTYEHADFRPGPSLNMVIGPNGTGKSSLVCAICLGLGWPPSVLGRADDFKSFVQHGKKDATIEIVLKGDPNQRVKVQIIREGNKRKWWINTKEASLKDVQALMKGLSIQIDNLCQFLPQEKVADFSGLSPKELLHSTQRAAAPPEMLEWHDRLIDLRKEQKNLILKHETNLTSLKSNQNKRDGLQDDVDKLQDLAEAEEKKKKLENCMPFVQYKRKHAEYNELKERRNEARLRQQTLQQRLEPTLQAVHEKEEYKRQIEDVKKERIQSVKDAERTLGKTLHDLDAKNKKIKDIEDSVQSEKQSHTARKQHIQAIRKKITELSNKQQNAPEFDAADWNRRIGEEGKKARALEAQIAELKAEEASLRSDASPLRRILDDTANELASLNSQDGRKFNNLRDLSRDSATLYEWIQEHQGEFEKTVYGPPLMECRIKEGYERFMDAVEQSINRETILSFTTQTRNDYQKLIDIFRNELHLSEIYVKNSPEPITAYQPPVSEQQMRELGFDGFALDYVDGAAPVLAMLCSTVGLHRTGISLRVHTADQHSQLISENSNISTWTAGPLSYRVSRRKEYGPGAVSISAVNISQARWWIDHSVDSSAKEELTAKRARTQQEYEELKERNTEVKNSTKGLEEQLKKIKKQKEDLQNNKDELQKEHTDYMGLPTRIAKEMENLEKRKQGGHAVQERLQELNLQAIEVTLEKAAIALKYKDQLVKLHHLHEELLEAEIWLLEATSDVETLKDRNKDIEAQLQQAATLVEQTTADTARARGQAKRLYEVVQDINTGLDTAEREELTKLAEEFQDEEELQHRIDAEQVFLDSNFTSNPNAKKDYEKYQANINKLERLIEESTHRLETYAAQITSVKEKWEPALDDLISKISDAFSFNFQQIGCAGEVTVHKDDDFDEWSLEIKVKFREGESLQLLDSHRQSGGERSVSTIFFLMSLQSMARAPFRVVDEINQGMDPRNERMVHERMVAIACKEHTSQYFLITPKLLPNLRYDPRMRVLCIASGEYMPQDHRMVSVSKAIAIKTALMAAG